MFCIKCGNQVPDGANFCPSCGQAVGVSNNNQYILTIKRLKEHVPGINPGIKVIVDGLNEYKLYENGEINVELNPGMHKVSFVFSFINQTETIDLTKDTVYSITWNRITGKVKMNLEK